MPNGEYAERRGAVDEQLEYLQKRQDNHAERLSNLEKFKERALGAIGVLSLMAGSGIVGLLAQLSGVL